MSECTRSAIERAGCYGDGRNLNVTDATLRVNAKVTKRKKVAQVQAVGTANATPFHVGQPSALCPYCASGRVFAASRTGGRVTSGRPSPERETKPAPGGPPGSLCASEFMHGPEASWKKTHQPEDAAVRRVWPSPAVLSSCRTGHRGLKSTTEELGVRRRVRTPHKWECLPVSSEALWDLVPLRPLHGQPIHGVAAVGATSKPWRRAAQIISLAASASIGSLGDSSVVGVARSSMYVEDINRRLPSWYSSRSRRQWRSRCSEEMRSVALPCLNMPNCKHTYKLMTS